MKVYISLPTEQKESELKSFLEGVSHLKRLGHNVMETTKPSLKSKENASKFYAASEKAIKDSDIVITEACCADSKVGYEISRAFNEKKIVIAMEDSSRKQDMNPIIHGNQSKSLIIKKYTKANVAEAMESALKEAAKRLDSKFILIISPEIDRYLDWASQTKRMHKAQVVRNALEGVMKKDKDYQSFLKS